MAFQFHHLVPEVRIYMASELESDISDARLYNSKWFNEAGIAAYPDLMRAACQEGDEEALAQGLSAVGAFVAQYEKRKPNGGTTMAAVPYTAAVTFAYGEFNRFYMRGVCLHAADQGIEQVTVYRAMQVENPRSASLQKIGAVVSAPALLADLRQNIGIDTHLGLPPGPNSGLSIRL